jgi:CRP-like cAMP-binding protein
VNIDKFVQRAEALHQQLADLYQTANVLPWIPSDLIPQAFRELHITSRIIKLAVEELQEQNDELIETRYVLEAERQKYLDLFELSPDGYLVTNLEGIIKTANSTAARLLNTSQSFLVNKPLVCFIIPDQKRQFYNELLQIQQSPHVREILLTLQPYEQESFTAACTVVGVKGQNNGTDTLNWSIRDISLRPQPEVADRENQGKLIPSRPLVKYAKGENIPLSPLFIWQVNQGVVKLTTLCATGEEVLMALVKKGMVFGSSLTALPIYQATAITDVELLSNSLADIQTFPQLSNFILAQTTQRLHQTELLLMISGRRRIQDRLDSFLEFLKQEFGQPVPKGIRLSIRLTHEEIASACCTTRVTITRLLGQLQAQGKVRFDEEKHMILSHL